MRIASIDTLKTFAILAIVLIHTRPFSAPEFANSPFFTSLFYFINQSSRFAVPFFFVASGYLFGRAIERGSGPWTLLSRYAKRIFIVFIVWSLVYGVIPPNWTTSFFQLGPLQAVYITASMNLERVIDSPLSFVVNGTGVHLWFLPALLIALTVLVVFISAGMTGYLVYIGILLYAVALLAGSYSTLLGVQLPFNGRNGPFFSTLFVLAGWWLSGRDAYGARVAFTVTLGGFIIYMAEVAALWGFLGASPDSHDFLIGSVPFGIGVFMICLAYPDFGRSTFLPSLGRFTLGVYVSHLLVKATIYPLFQGSLNVYLFQFLYPLAVYLISIALTFALLKTPIARRMVL